MPIANANGIELYYDAYGSEDAEPILLIMGLGTQATGWDEAFCKALARTGYFVVRYDNRDVGMSTHFGSREVPDLFAALAGKPEALLYTLEDMAEDAYCLLRALNIPKAHVVGASMGGMIAQLLTIHHAESVMSLVSIMSTTGEFGVGAPTPETVEALITPPRSTEKEDVIDSAKALFRMIESPAYRLTDRQLDAFVRQNYERGHSEFGTARQLCAILAAEDRTEALREIQVPTTVIHGDSDPLVDIDGGEATAKAIPHADFVVIPGMGHSLPPQLWPQLIAIIDATAKRARH